MSPVPTAKDLIVVVADLDAEVAIKALLKRHEALGIQRISFDVRRHVQRDPGCRTAAHSFLLPERARYKHALVVFDWEGAGAEEKDPEEIEIAVEATLAKSGWDKRCAAIVIKPEFEMWLWSDSPHVHTALGWGNRQPAVQDWIKANTAFWPVNTKDKPDRPKEALEAVLRAARKSASPSLFESLAERVSVTRCTDRAFGKFKAVLRRWFGNADYDEAVLRIREEPAHYAANIELDRMQHMGNIGLLKSAWAAFFCSVRCPGNLILKAYDLAQKWRAEGQPVIGGFHSPVEKEVLKIMLRSTVPVCVVLARSLPKRISPEFRRPLDEGRLLLLSPFDAKTKRATRETAGRRNHVVAALAEKIVVAYAAPGSKTETFCREIAGVGKPCLTFDDPRTANLRELGFRPY
ncbi:MAG: hypothetical protein HY343_11965 [Lentisphaerae bacterium]|nr:hypothetical protein [Lentisphaerota bacterium]